jgi:hypothetical protein
LGFALGVVRVVVVFAAADEEPESLDVSECWIT